MDTIPTITLVGDQLEGTISLPIWSRFQSRQGSYGSIDPQEHSDGIFQLSIGGDMIVDKPEITTYHINAYTYLSTHSEQICSSILNHLFSEYKNLQADYSYDYDEAEIKEMMPDIETVEQFRNLIGLSRIHIMNVAKDGHAYVGYEFGCTWEEEHGLGFMTHKDRIIDFGGADTSFMTWVAKKDLDK